MFRIGEFSKIAQVSARLLRYYDQVSLFKPARIDSFTGYRYYSARQLPELNRILALKELGLTLDQIARLIAGEISTDEIRGMLVMKKAQMEQTLRQELIRIRYIESRIDQIENEGQLREYEVVLKTVPSQKFIAARYPTATLADCRAAVEEIQGWLPAQLPAHVGNRALGPMAMLIHSDLWDAESMDVELGFFLNGELAGKFSLPSGPTMRMQNLPAVEWMATAIHMGIPETGHQSYAALGLWAEAHQYQFGSPSREIFIRLPPVGSDELVAEIQIPVEPAS